MLSAMILAAGRGERMRPLTDHTPKPLIQVAGQPLLGWHLEQLESADVDHVVINHAWLGDVLEAGVNAYWQHRRLPIRFSAEHQLGLETAGGILKALPQLSDPFVVVNGDIFTEFNLHEAVDWARNLAHDIDARLVLVPNPLHHSRGDFVHLESGRIALDGEGPRYTFAGISVLRHSLFAGFPKGVKLPLLEVLRPSIQQGRVEGSITDAFWMDVGTPERLGELRARYKDFTPCDVA